MTTTTETPFVMQHQKTKMFLAKNDKDVYKYGSGVAGAIGAKGHYKWVRTAEEAIVFATEAEADTVLIMMDEPPVWFIDHPELVVG